MAKKTWTVYDTSQDGPIEIRQVAGGKLVFEQLYAYLDKNGDELPIGRNVVRVRIDWDAIPNDIQSALVQIKNFMHAKALEQEEVTSE